MPRRKKKSQAYVYTDTPEIQSLGAGFARQGYFRQGYGEAREFGNKLAMRATAVPADQKAQIAYLAGRYGAYGEPAGSFLQPITGVKLQKELGLSRHYLDKEFEKNIRQSPAGFQQSNINGLDVLRAYKHPQPPPIARAVTRRATSALSPPFTDAEMYTYLTRISGIAE